jgi:hypothetical protein
MPTFVLVHGSTHSARAWDLVKAELEHRDERPRWNYGKVSYSYLFLPYRKQRALQTQ